jgi:hypothetical protein
MKKMKIKAAMLKRDEPKKEKKRKKERKQWVP